MKKHRYLEQELVWHETADFRCPFETDFEGKHLTLQMNSFPDEHLYSLLEDGEIVCEFDDWSEQWSKARHSGEYKIKVRQKLRSA